MRLSIRSIFRSILITIILITAVSAKDGYLIITDSQYSNNSSLLEFITFREKLYNVTVKTVSEAGGTATQIKSFIKSKYNTDGLGYVLFVGKAGAIPYETNQYPTYQHYGDVNGTGYMDVAIGCFFVRSSSDLTNIINKTIYTENNISDYPKTQIQFSTFVDDQHIFNECGVIRDNFWESAVSQDLTYATSWMVPDPSKGESNGEYKQAVLDAIDNNEATFVAYQGHGFETGWVDQVSISNSDADASTNDEVYPIILSNACLTGSFQSSSKCFGEAWTTAENGAVAFYGASNNSYSYQKKFNAGWACGVAKRPEITKLGDLFAYAKAFVRDSTMTQSGFSVSTEHETMYNLFGDPALEFRKTPEGTQISQFSKKSQMSTMKISSVTKSSFDITVLENGNYSISLLTANGRLVKSVSANNLSAGKNSINWNGITVSNGVYFVSVSGMGLKVTNKVIFD